MLSYKLNNLLIRNFSQKYPLTNLVSTRHTMIFGKATPYYDDNKAFDRIVNDILPIATRDIWENVYNYFNDKNEPHLPEHVKIIKRMYKSYISINKEK